MEVTPVRLDVEFTDGHGRSAGATVPIGSSGSIGLGPLEVDLDLNDTGAQWSLANRGDRPVRVRSVSLVFALTGASGPVRMFRNGYQSWSPSTTGVLGVDTDPSLRADFEFLQAVHHADQRRARPGELRSEWVTVLADGSGGGPVLFGFDGGDRHAALRLC